jgi:endonuclease/exonuclease/phosphatase family metal-dependent hydrolase
MRPLRATGVKTGAASVVVVAAIAAVVLALSGDVRATGDRETILQFNMCGHACNRGGLDVVPPLENSIRDRQPFVVTLNEVCETQYDSLRTALSAYQGRFDPTGPRCRNGARYGNALLVRSSEVDFVGTWELPNPAQDEPRRLMCVRTRVGDESPVRVCVTHISNEQGNIAAQVTAVASILKDLPAGDAVILGGDFNTDPGDPRMNPLYSADYGSGTGKFHEADAAGDHNRSVLGAQVDGDTINEHTYSDHKFDYVFLSDGDWDSLTAEADGSNPHSDHRALWAAASLRRTPADGDSGGSIVPG